MVAIKSLIFSALFATAALAQEPSNNFSSAEIQGLATLNSTPNSPDASMKVSWCVGQMSLCGTLCNGDNSNNHCDPTSLNWTCTCNNGNGSTPALQYYPFSIIGNECHALQANCIDAHPNDQAGQSACQTQYVCGNATQTDAVNAAKGSSSSSQSSSSPSGSGSPSSTSPSSSSSSSSPSATPTHNAAPSYKVYGPGAIAMAAVGIVAVAL